MAKKIKKDKLASVNDYQELVGKYQRALADYQNLIKQKEVEKIEFAKYANQSLLEDLLPVYDHLKMSLKHTGETDNSWLEGVKHVLKQFKNVLASRGVVEIETINQKFDVNRMEAVEKVVSNKQEEDNLVAKELKTGYLMNDRVISPAKVAVYEYQNKEDS